MSIGLVITVIPGGLALSTWAQVQALKAQWTVAGPPCQVVAQAPTSVVGRKPPLTFQYGGVTFSRAFAAANCQALPEDTLFTRESFPVCQFNNPGAVTVTAGGRSVIFQPPVGRRATVTVRHGAPSCVVGGWFDY
ncbi:MAG: hypothetical protein ABI655_01780 [Phenylobacterium sp.]